MNLFDRRELLKTAAVLPFGLGSFPFRWLPGGDDRCLVVLELAGGNDGLNTIIPLEDPAYARARSSLESVRASALPLGGGFGLHGSMAGVHGLIQSGLCAVVHGVGYPGPDRSHFRSRDIWQTADPEHQATRSETTGWLGRAADWLSEKGAAVPGLSVGTVQVPLARRGRRVGVPTLERGEDYQLLVDPAGGRESQRLEALRKVVQHGTAGHLAAFVGEVARSAMDGAERMAQALDRYQPKANYPETGLGRQLQLLSRVLVSGFGTRLFHISYGGFDTHARQAPAHDGLLRQLSNALAALSLDLKSHDLADRVVILVHSEFGRRLAENRSQGTDHGTAGPVFLVSGAIRPGLHGEPPSLETLVDGDPVHTCDFRAVYADCLRWLGVDDELILGGKFQPLGLFA